MRRIGWLGALGLMSSCEGVESVNAFAETVGCYANEGQPQLHIRNDGKVFDGRGQELGIASFLKRTSQIEIQPGVEFDRSRMQVVSTHSQSSVHMVSEAAGDIVLTVNSPDPAQPGVLLTMVSGNCLPPAR